MKLSQWTMSLYWLELESMRMKKANEHKSHCVGRVGELPSTCMHLQEDNI